MISTLLFRFQTEFYHPETERKEIERQNDAVWPGINKRLRTFTESNEFACKFHGERWSGQGTSRKILNRQIWFTPNEFNTQTIGGRDVAVRWTAETLRSTRKFRFRFFFFFCSCKNINCVSLIGLSLVFLFEFFFSILITPRHLRLFLTCHFVHFSFFFFSSISSPPKDRSNRCGYRWNLRHGHRWHSSVAFKSKFFFSCSHAFYAVMPSQCHNLWGNSLSFQWAPIVQKINKNHTQRSALAT